MESLFDDIPEFAPRPKRKSRHVFSTLGASNHCDNERAEADLYCTHPEAVDKLLTLETFNRSIWEPCCGLGHISDTLERYGHEVKKTDIISRRPDIEFLDFLAVTNNVEWHGDIITNPPYNQAAKMVYKALSAIDEGCKVAMWLRILFLESMERKELFTKFPPSTVYISSKRIPCAKNGDFERYTSSAQGYAWFIWVKGYPGPTILKWF